MATQHNSTGFAGVVPEVPVQLDTVGEVTMTPVEEFLQVDGNQHTAVIPKVVSKITELTLDQLKNNYQIFAHKLANADTGLVIRAILLKNNKVIFNYCKISGYVRQLKTTFLDHEDRKWKKGGFCRAHPKKHEIGKTKKKRGVSAPSLKG